METLPPLAMAADYGCDPKVVSIPMRTSKFLLASLTTVAKLQSGDIQNGFIDFDGDVNIEDLYLKVETKVFKIEILRV